jgi:hypothetical protein
MRKKKFNTREDALQDTLNYFWGRPELKCENLAKNTCLYSPTGKSEGCAVGRHLPIKLANKLDTFYDFNGVENDMVFNKLPKWMQSLGQDFWRSLQTLHDNDVFVKKDKNFVRERMKKYLDMNKITFPE